MKSILLVEDSKFLQRATERILQKAGYSVTTAADGEEAVRIATTEAPDLILLDMLLPKLSGTDVLHALRACEVTANIPVIVLSGLSQKNEAKLINEGANAYVEKSRIDLRYDSLLEIVKRTLEHSTES